MPVLIKFKSDYADEFDVEQIRLILDKDLTEVKDEIERICEISQETELYFGTNEFLEALHKEEFSVKYMTPERAKSLIETLDLQQDTSYTLGVGILQLLFTEVTES